MHLELLVQIQSPQLVALTQLHFHYIYFYLKSDAGNSWGLYLRLLGNSVFQNGAFLRRKSQKMFFFLKGNCSHVLSEFHPVLCSLTLGELVHSYNCNLKWSTDSYWGFMNDPMGGVTFTGQSDLLYLISKDTVVWDIQVIHLF